MRTALAVLLLSSAALCAQTSGQTPAGPASGQAAASQQQAAAPESMVLSSENKWAWDIGVWGSGGHSVSGGLQGVGVGNAGVRVGKILTEEHGRGWLRGNFEYAVDLIPIYVLTGVPDRVQVIAVLCPTTIPSCGPRFNFVGGSTVYGGGFNPFDVKWNFTAGQRFSPYLELNGGVLFTNKDVPVTTSNVNFMSGATLGVNIFTRAKRAVSLEVKYTHISNAGLASPNPGLNTVQAEIGYHWFK